MDDGTQVLMTAFVSIPLKVAIKVMMSLFKYNSYFPKNVTLSYFSWMVDWGTFLAQLKGLV